MKKILTFAIVALLLGGFTFNASAQDRQTKNAEKKTVLKKDVKKGDVEKTLKSYEEAVEKCVSLFNAMQNIDKTAKSGGAKDFESALKKAENLKAQIEGKKDQLDKNQVDRFKKANEKLNKVYIK